VNQRIQELALRAGFIDRGSNHTAYMNFDHEKFAELIVRECVQFIDTGADKFSDGDWLRTSVRDIGVMIKEHFEVED